MNGIKTIHDIQSTLIIPTKKQEYINGVNDCIIKSKEIATKWVNELENQLQNKELKGLESPQEKAIGLSATIEWIKMFFRLTT